MSENINKPTRVYTQILEGGFGALVINLSDNGIVVEVDGAKPGYTGPVTITTWVDHLHLTRLIIDILKKSGLLVAMDVELPMKIQENLGACVVPREATDATWNYGQTVDYYNDKDFYYRIGAGLPPVVICMNPMGTKIMDHAEARRAQHSRFKPITADVWREKVQELVNSMMLNDEPIPDYLVDKPAFSYRGGKLISLFSLKLTPSGNTQSWNNSPSMRVIGKVPVYILADSPNQFVIGYVAQSINFTGHDFRAMQVDISKIEWNHRFSQTIYEALKKMDFLIMPDNLKAFNEQVDVFMKSYPTKEAFAISLTKRFKRLETSKEAELTIDSYEGALVLHPQAKSE